MLPPMELPTAICAVCGKYKGPTNNWFKALTVVNPVKPSDDGIAFGGSDVSINDGFDDVKVEDICGSACLHTRLSRWIDAHQALPTATAPTTQESETK